MGALGSKVRGAGGHAAGLAFRTSPCIFYVPRFMFRDSCLMLYVLCFAFYVTRLVCRASRSKFFALRISGCILHVLRFVFRVPCCMLYVLCFAMYGF